MEKNERNMVLMKKKPGENYENLRIRKGDLIGKVCTIVELEDESSITGALIQILAPESKVRQELISLLSDTLRDCDEKMDDESDIKIKEDKRSDFPLNVEVEVDICSNQSGDITKVKNCEVENRMGDGVQTNILKNIGNVVTFI